MRFNPSFVVAVAGLCAAAVAPSALAQHANLRLDPTEVVREVCTHTGPSTFRLADPSAAVCDASRVAPASARVQMADDGWRAHSTVFLHRDDLGAALPHLPAAPRALAGASDWVSIDVPTVGDALDLAHDLAAARGLRAHVELERPWTLRMVPTDDLLADQWHLINTVAGDELVDLDADGAWNAGYTGEGVTVGVVELGFRAAHVDLIENYSSEASQSIFQPTSHGTSVAGLIASGANEDGTVGLAYNATISQQEIGSPATTAAAYDYRNDLNDIKNHSYGPADNGWIHNWDPVEETAVRNAMVSGRGGLGTVFVWAGGNGGAGGVDRVDYDPYASSRYSIAINGFNDDDEAAHWTEPGSSVFAATPSSGLGANRGLTTTAFANSGGNPVDTWINDFGFSSGAAPLGAAVVALMLEANPNLTWIDAQHVLANSTRDIGVSDGESQLNGANRRHHERLGFGALVASAAAETAAAHQPVGEQVAIQTPTLVVNETLPDAPSNEGPFTAVSRTFTVADDIEIDHVELVLTLDSGAQGDVRITLSAPSGATSTFAERRFNDFRDTVKGRAFTSVRHWGERSAGEWTVTLTDELMQFETIWQDAQLRFYGSCRPADTTGAVPGSPPDGLVTLVDFSVYLSRWATGDPAADITAPGVAPEGGGCATGYGLNRPAGDGVTIDDFMCYLTRWTNGCPPSIEAD